MVYQVDPRAVNQWSARITPVILMGVVGYTTYVLVVRLCVSHLLRHGNWQPGTVIALLVIYFLLFTLMATTYFRILYIVNFDPGFIPLGPGAKKKTFSGSEKTNRRESRRRGSQSIGGREYGTPDTGPGTAPDLDPDSPGLEEFYTKQVFVCESDGRPKWCSDCCSWKPDRAHHCSDVGRCVRKMDHFCPWVGGVVGENSFKFFIQFVTYTFLYCTFLVVVMAIYVHKQLTSKIPAVSLDPHFAAIIGLGAFFGLFTGALSTSSTQFAVFNLTTIENLNKTTKVWQLATLLPTSVPILASGRLALDGADFTTITYPLPVSSEKSSGTMSSPDNFHEQPSQPTSPHSSPDPDNERDSKATRSFAVLRMESGQNPWDLGAYGNWKSVMGSNLLDWCLPVLRSPCCNHESPVSQFAVGRWVEQLRVDHGLLPASEVKSPRPRASKRQERVAKERRRDVEMANLDN